MSGFTPGATLRNTLRIAASPKTSDVLLCSAVITRLCVPTGRVSTPGPSRKLSASSCRPASMCRSQASVTSLSCSASYHQTRGRPSESVTPTSTWVSESAGAGRATSGTW